MKKTRQNNHPLRNIWAGMKARCFNPNNPDYKNYGAVGITICRRWLVFKNFCEDMGDRPEGHSIDRIDSTGNYCKANCRWATSLVQANNTKRNNYIEYKGQTKTLSQWIRHYGLKPSTVKQRLYVYKWPFERCITK